MIPIIFVCVCVVFGAAKAHKFVIGFVCVCGVNLVEIHCGCAKVANIIYYDARDSNNSVCKRERESQ